MSSVTAIVNLYRRPEKVTEIVKAINHQTHPVEKLVIWQNGPDSYRLPMVDNLVKSVENLGVWARFSFALNAETDYVVIFDDDTIPGPGWVKNCLNTIEEYGPALLGTVGLRLQSRTNYQQHTRHGWPNPTTAPRIVDLVGHSWFFKPEWLWAMWKDMRPKGFNFVGEDMHLSFALQKYLGISTMVPPHPADNKDMWGSIDGFNSGTDQHSIWETDKDNARSKMDQYLQHLLDLGWKLQDV